MERTRSVDGKGFDGVPGEADSANIVDDGASTVEDDSQHLPLLPFPL